MFLIYDICTQISLRQFLAMLKLKRFKVIKENKIEKVHNYAHLNNKSAVE